MQPVALPAETAQRADAPQHADKAQHANLALPSPQEEDVAAPADVPEQPAAPLASRSPRKKADWSAEIDDYLWTVYQRSAVKKDSSGDFTWKDEAAAARMGVVTKQYVIGGMDLDFRELLYTLGHAMDADGLKWTILSGFRDDYRQGLASGYKARVGNSFHGGSRATGGYGHGCAADIEAVDGESDGAVWRWVDQHGEKFGVFRPMKQIDPAHIQPFGAWHDVALNLRTKDVQNAYLPASVDGADAEKPPVASLVDTRSGVSEAQFDCVRSHGGHFRMAGHHAFPGSHVHRAVLVHGGRFHRFGRRRMIVDINGPEKHASADTEAAGAQTGENVRAEASGKTRGDAAQHKIAHAGRKEKHQGKEAGADRMQRGAKAQDVKGKDARPQTVAGNKPPQKRAADAAKRQDKASKARVANEAKAKNRVADQENAPPSKKL